MQSAEMLQTALERFPQTWLLVDALDELDARTKDDFMGVVESLKNTTKFFFTSRPQSLDSAILEESTLHSTLSAHNEDLATYIRARMGKTATASRRVRESPGWNNFVDETVTKLVSIADGMFILVSLQLDMLLRPRTLAEMRRLLSGVSDKLDDFYAATLERIRARESAVAVNVLCWLVKQMQPLTAGALQEALAVEESTQRINPEAFIHKDDMVEMCCGLLAIDENEVLSLAHATIHEFLSAKLDEIKQFDSTMTKSCLRYLTFETFQHQTSNYARAVTGPARSPDTLLPDDDKLWFDPNPTDQEYIDRTQRQPFFFDPNPTDQEYIDRTQQHPFFSYAAYHWDTHYTKCGESGELTEMALRLINGPNAAAMLQVYNRNKILDFQSLGPLHVAAYLGQLHLVKILIAQATRETLESKSQGLASDLGRLVDCSDDFGNTPLLYAMKNNKVVVALALLQTKAVNPSVGENTMIRWALERSDKSLLRMMVQMPKFNKRLALRQFGQQIEIYLESDPMNGEREHFYEFTGYSGVKIAGPWKSPSHTVPSKTIPSDLDRQNHVSDSRVRYPGPRRAKRICL